MLLIDGVKYNLWCPPDEVRDFHPIIKEHSKEIFGESSEFFKGSKLSSIEGINRIPDGIVIIFGDSPCWHIVEVELSDHDLYKHIVHQVTDFITTINNDKTRQRTIEKINKIIKEDESLKLILQRMIPNTEIHEFLTNVIFKPPILTIIIENNAPRIEEVLSSFRNNPNIADIKVVEFQTYVQENCDLSVHAHLFEPLIKKDSEYKVFLEKLRTKLIIRRHDLKPSNPSESLCWIATGHKRIHFEWLFYGKEPKLGVELHFEREKKRSIENRQLLEKIKTNKDALEKSIGEQLHFEFDRKWGERDRKWSRVYTVKEVEWTPEFEEWAIDTMIKFYDVFKPILDKIDTKNI